MIDVIPLRIAVIGAASYTADDMPGAEGVDRRIARAGAVCAAKSGVYP